ncbi:MAG: hypothetical protein IJ167_05275 [Lachnospiraceae bacterium]|nr:hypothetical protein [Lachnospiraceae bacterium]
MEKYIIYINYNNSVIEYVLPGLNDRTGQINLADETGIILMIIIFSCLAL